MRHARAHAFALPGFVLFLVLFLSPRAGAQPLSDFEDGLQGWTKLEPFNGDLEHRPTEGHPGGFMYVEDNLAGGGSLVVVGPATFAGDLSIYLGVQWDEYLYDQGPLHNGQPTFVQIEGPDGTVYNADVNLPPDLRNVWRTRFVEFDPQNWSQHGPASFQSVLQNVVRLRLMMETGTDGRFGEAGADNVTLVPVSGDPPSIYLHPESQTVVAGTQVTLQVAASGTPPFSHQWYKDDLEISGATNADYVIDSTVLLDAGEYRVVVTNNYGSSASEIAVLQVYEAVPVITTHPESQTLCEGASVDLRVAATGGSLSYQWRKGGTDIVGATNDTYPLGPASSADAGTYDVVVSNHLGSITSDPATIDVDTTPLLILQQPVSQTVFEGDLAQFSVSVIACGPIRYQWQYNNQGLEGATESVYTFTASLENAGSYRCLIYNDIGLMFTTSATLTVQPRLAIEGLGGTQALYVSQSTTLGALLIAETPVTYEWHKDGVPIPGASETIVIPGLLHSLSYELGPVDFVDAGTYSIHAFNLYGAADSAPEQITVLDPFPLVLEHPRGGTFYTGEPVHLAIAAQGLPVLSYQWRKDDVDIGGATGDTYEMTASLANAGIYEVQVQNTLGAVFSDAAPVVVVEAAPTILQHPRSHEVPPQGCSRLLVIARGSEPLQYQWRKDGFDIPGATSLLLDLGASPSDGSYEVEVSNAFGSIVSDAATLTTNPFVYFVGVVVASPVYGSAPLTVRFDARQSSGEFDSCGNFDYDWDFGDSYGTRTHSTEPVIEHTYQSLGKYVATVVLDYHGWQDEAQITIEVSDGPYVGAPDTRLFQDSFANDGTLAGPIRLDMAQDIATGSSANVAGDSVVVDIVPVVPGTNILDPPSGWGGVLHWVMVANPAFDSERSDGLDWAGASQVGTDSRGWNIWEGQVEGKPTSGGDPLGGRYWFDLPDGPATRPHQSYDPPMFFPGDVLQYYIQSEDDAGNVSTLPTSIANFGSFETSTVYDPRFTVHGLPTVDPLLGEQPGLLLWNDAGHGAEEQALLFALLNLGFRHGSDFDLYTTNAAEMGVSNGLGSAGTHGANPDQLAGYDALVYVSGDLSSRLLSDGSNEGRNDKGNDIDTVSQWFLQDADRCLAHFGDNGVSALLADSPASGSVYSAIVLGVNLWDGDVRDEINGQQAPLVTPATGSPWYTTEFVAHGTGPVPSTFDNIEPMVGAVRTHEFVEPESYSDPVPYGPPARAASVSWDRLEGSQRKATVVFPYGFGRIRSNMNADAGSTALSARSRLLQEILDQFGIAPGGASVDVPPAQTGTLVVERSRPNPFNPSTEIVFRTPARTKISVKVYDIRGQLVTTLLDGTAEVGEHRLRWEGRDRHGVAVASGVYLVEVKGLGQKESIKVALVK